ncbi:MAG: TIGR04282 family arsenosugar biosynthesis glycosyltransferase [Chloroflexota bacterium]|nr:TIGR04282 family arsenosugar biosynthesis glycosyltransferase [Chloroflexota bacterium]
MLAKWPGTGRAKRRLGVAVGTPASTALARAFLTDTATLAARCEAGVTIVACAPPSAAGRMSVAFPGARLVAQPRGSLGTRLADALDAGLERAHAVVLIGTDSPTLDPRIVQAAFTELNGGADCVLGPSRDGGYYLIGCRTHLPRTLFSSMPWSTAAVFSTTRERVRAAGLRLAVLPEGYDVDDAVSLALLRSDQAGLRRAPATAATLREIGLA